MFGSDHAPHTYEEKCQDYDSAPGGIPSVETNLPVLMAMVKHNMLPLELIVRMGAENPAKRFGINKGRIAAGYDADLIVFDMSDIRKVDQDRLHSRAGYSPYDGMEAIFPDTVFVRGQMQIEDGEFSGSNIGEDLFVGD